MLVDRAAWRSARSRSSSCSLIQPHRAWGAWTINTLYWLGIAQGAIVLACAIRLVERSLGVLDHAHRGVVLGLPAIRARARPRAAGRRDLELPALGARTCCRARRRSRTCRSSTSARIVGLGLLWWLTRDLVRAVAAHRRPSAQGSRIRRTPARLREAGAGLDAATRPEVAWQRHRSSQRAPQIVVLYAIVFTRAGVGLHHGAHARVGEHVVRLVVLHGRLPHRHRDDRLRRHAVRERIPARGLHHAATTSGTSARSPSASASSGSTSSGRSTWRSGTPTCPTRPVGCSCASRTRGARSALHASSVAFLVPFLGLMNMDHQEEPVLARACSALMILTGMWMERHVLVMPSLNPDAACGSGLPEIGVTLGFLGVFGFAVQGFLRKYPPVKLGGSIIRRRRTRALTRDPTPLRVFRARILVRGSGRFVSRASASSPGWRNWQTQRT